jgi:protein-glutamine gamma-glutamyltransferase
MPKGTAARLIRKFRPGESLPENSLALRAAVAAAVVISMTALLKQDVVSAGTAFIVIGLTPAGYLFSYTRRRARNTGVKIFLAAGLLVVFANFLRTVSGASSLEETIGPLAEIFLWVQALHAFDLPRRKDLQFSLAASITLMALGGAIAFDTSFLLFFIPWGAASMAALAISHRSEAAEAGRDAVHPAVVSRRPDASRRRPSVNWRAARGVAAVTAVVLAAGAVTFAFAPRGTGSRFAGLSFKLRSLVRLPSDAGIVNPGLPASGPSQGSEPARPRGVTYFGFSNSVDLRVRGRPSDELVMRVRAAQPAFWRGAAFDVYSNSSWTSSSKKPHSLNGLPMYVLPEEGGSGGVAAPRAEQLNSPGAAIPPRSNRVGSRTTVEMIQTFYVESQQPNIAFAAYQPSEVYFPGGSLKIDDFGSMQAGFLLDPGTTYSVISNRPAPSETDLAGDASEIPPAIVSRFTQLPAGMPQRVKNLAFEIAGREPTVLGKANAIEDWLKKNTKYLLEIPPQPRGADAVDHFLFEDRRGFCEQIASAMIVMLRELGVPARFVTGYATGHRNLLSGYFEVSASDAHSWVEVYFPRAGWTEFDPTGVVPVAEASPVKSLPGFKALGALGSVFRNIGKLFPKGVASGAARAALSAIRAFAQNGFAMAGAVVVVSAAIFGSRRLARFLRRRLRERRLRRPLRGTPDAVVVGAFRLVEETGKLAGIPRAPSSTPSEYAGAIAQARPSGAGDIEMVVAALQREIYGGTSSTPKQAAEAAAAARRVGDELLKLAAANGANGG